MDTSFVSPEAGDTAPRKGSWAKWVLWGCGGTLILFLLLGLSCFVFVKSALKIGNAELGPACMDYLARIERKDLSGAYQLMGEAGKANLSQDQHDALIGGILDRLGPIQSTEVQFVGAGTDMGGSWGRIIYKTRFQNGPGTIRFELRKYSGKYKIIGVFFESPVLTDAITKALAKPSAARPGSRVIVRKFLPDGLEFILHFQEGRDDAWIEMPACGRHDDLASFVPAAG